MPAVLAIPLCFTSMVAISDPSPSMAAAEEPVQFDIWAFRIDGNTLLDDQTVERAVYPFVGPGKGIPDVEQARTALEKSFHDAGYATVLVDIPEQDVNEGLVVLSVTQGQIDRLKVAGSQYHSLRKIRDKVPALAEGQVPHMPSVQKQMESLAGDADLKVTPIMRAGKTPGKLEVELQVDDTLPLHGSVEMNSRNNANTTYSRLIGSIRYDNLWQLGHSASLQYQVSPQNYDEVEVWSGTYALPTGLWDSRLAFYGVGIDSNTDIASAGALAVVGSGEIYGLRWILPLDSSASGFYQTATFGFDYKSFGQSVVLIGADTQNSPITYAPFLLGYALMHQGTDRLSSIDLGLHFSIRGLGNDPQEFADRRFNAKPDYFYFTGEFRHQEILPYDLRLLFRGGGQITSQPLISNEQYSAGGVGSVRGYHMTEVLGDDGMTGSVELFSPTLWNTEQIQELRLLGFAEGARLWVREALPGTPADYRLASSGAGLRIKAFKNLVGEFDWAYPFYTTEFVKAGNMRVDFRVAYGF